MKLVWSMIQCICNVYCCSGEWCGSCAFYSIFLSWHLSAFIFIKKLLFYSNVMTSSNRQRWTHNRVSISTGQWRTLRKAKLLRLWFNGISIWWDATYILFKVRNDNYTCNPPDPKKRGLCFIRVCLCVCVSVCVYVCVSVTKISVAIYQWLIIADAWYHITLFLKACHIMGVIFILVGRQLPVEWRLLFILA